MTLVVNGSVASSFIYSAGHEIELVTGFLLSAGLIEHESQIDCLEIKGEECHVVTKEATLRKEEFQSQLSMNHEKLLKVRDALTSNQKNHYATRGFHGAIIWEIPTGKWFVCEDIGRHNAVDTVIGHGMREGYSLSQSMVLLSGRLVSNIVSKCVNSKILMIASMTVATDRGIELARDAKMTIIGSLSEDGFWLYHEGAVKVT